MTAKSVIAVIPARGGSKGLPGKNIMPLHSKPLIAYTVEAALESCVDSVWVSTDSDDIEAVALEAGAKVITRPSSMATDTS